MIGSVQNTPNPSNGWALLKRKGTLMGKDRATRRPLGVSQGLTDARAIEDRFRHLLLFFRRFVEELEGLAGC